MRFSEGRRCYARIIALYSTIRVSAVGCKPRRQAARGDSAFPSFGQSPRVGPIEERVDSAMTSQWRDTQPGLHKFNRQVHDLFNTPSRLAWLHEQLLECAKHRSQSRHAEQEWEEGRRKYFEESVQKVGASVLRDQTKPHKNDTVWDHYRRDLPAAEVVVIPYSYRKNIYIRSETGSDGAEVQSRTNCFREFPDGRGAFDLCAWTPLAFVSFDSRLRFYLPLPPDDIPRDYAINEICFALTALHDADGAYDALVPSHSALRAELGSAFSFLLQRLRHDARSSWVVSIEPLADRVSGAILAFETSSQEVELPIAFNGVVDKKARDRWLYTLRSSGRVWKEIHSACKNRAASEGWFNDLHKESSVRAAVTRYAENNSLPLDKKASGRPPKVL
ncbi:hypothetical protein PLANPX_3256 [Lacipirellula parvula]|uniref:Uncharacterized protein n=1 Tax=Lacipirellula parvula TaxID=2650471 RepID=A0A5K7XAA5_9BACT|nr:hypothetical protein PLANPX_3256 [Lacipirellula parvula]